MTKFELESTIISLNQTLEAQKAQLDQLTQLLQLQLEQLQSLQALIEAKDEEIARLKEQLNKNSRNSSKPPTSDGYKKPTSNGSKVQSDKKVGGQKGHTGSHLSVPNVKKSYKYHMPACCHGCPRSEECQRNGRVCASRNVLDAVVEVSVTEHQQIQISKCPLHGYENIKGEFPKDITAPVQYGDGIQALAVALSTHGAVSACRVHDILGGVFSIPISAGTIVSMVSKCAKNLPDTLTRIRDEILAFHLNHSDETGGRINGKLKWIHFIGNDKYSYLSLSQFRGQKGMDEIGILPNYTGTVVHDCWAPYWKYPKIRHAICNAHILRELTGVTENYPDQPWAEQFRLLLLSMKKVADKAKEQGKAALSYYYRHKFSKRYDEIIAEAMESNPIPEPPKGKRGRRKKGKVRSLIERLQANKAAVCLFVNDLTVPFDNNLAERGLRMTKAKFKIAGCFRTDEGCQEYLDIMSYVDSARKQGKSAFEAILMAVKGTPELMFSWANIRGSE